MKVYVLVNPKNNRLVSNKIPSYPSCLPEYKVVYGFTADMGIQVPSNYRNNEIGSKKQSAAVIRAGYCAYLGHFKELLSHYDNYLDEDLLILEDDVEFNPNFNIYYDNFMHKVPDDWDAIYFGGWCRGQATEVVPDVLKLTGIHGLECVLLRSQTVKVLLDEIVPNKDKGGKQVDVAMSELIANKVITAYRPIVPFAMQPPNYSAHTGTYMNRTVHYFAKYISINGEERSSSVADFNRYG